jgi:hypothetical protein
MSAISRPLRALVIARAENRCEYCQLSQDSQEAAFHIDHVVPRSADGPTEAANLALACVSCSLRKCAKQSATDPDSGQVVQLFNPRIQRWNEHFRWNGETLAALTAIGRGTLAALAMNRPLVVAIRREEAVRGRFPP